jgi:hypothetical protein
MSCCSRQPAACRYDVIFLRDPLTPDEAMKSVSPKPARLLDAMKRIQGG